MTVDLTYQEVAGQSGEGSISKVGWICQPNCKVTGLFRSIMDAYSLDIIPAQRQAGPGHQPPVSVRPQARGGSTESCFRPSNTALTAE